jgi:ABC-type amino acid transport substrate-binding protein
MRIRKVSPLALLVVALLLIVALLPVIRITPENHTYIIGWDVDPPDQVATNSGEPTGFAVELVREAAKRRGIRLRWVLRPESSEAALRSKVVDLWPMMVITEDRKQILHLTDPYQENEYGLLVDAKALSRKPAILTNSRSVTMACRSMGDSFGSTSLERFIYGSPPLRMRSELCALAKLRQSSPTASRCSHSC